MKFAVIPMMEMRHMACMARATVKDAPRAPNAGPFMLTGGRGDCSLGLGFNFSEGSGSGALGWDLGLGSGSGFGSGGVGSAGRGGVMNTGAGGVMKNGGAGSTGRFWISRMDGLVE